MTTSVEDRIGLEDRVSCLEGAYEHLATKADLADLRAELKEDMGKLQVSLIKWMVGLVLGGMVGVTGLVIAVMRLMG